MGMSSVGSLLRLGELVPAPDYPVGANGDWKRFWSVNGFTPPEDYRMMIREYGVGTFGGWLTLIEPFNERYTFRDKAEAECRAVYRNSQHQFPWPLWPDPGGFLPWATTVSGDHIGWLTRGMPTAWTTAFWGRGGRHAAEYPVGAVGFIVGLLERVLGDPVLDDPANSPVQLGRMTFVPVKL